MSIWFALMAKPMLVSLPCILLLLDIWPLRRWKLWRIDDQATVLSNRKRHAHFARESPAGSSVRDLQRHCVYFAEPRSRISPTATFPLSGRVANAIVGYHFYLEKLFVPIKLAVFYPYPGHWRPQWLRRAHSSLSHHTGGDLVSPSVPWLLIGWLWFVVRLFQLSG